MAYTKILLILICATCTIALVIAESRQWQRGKAIFKCAASTSFVAFALQCSALSSDYGRLILIALILSWIGDMLLL
ncbi:MAG: lysoplasmalogenase family protein, partial [Methylococcales bacterium]